MNATQNNSRPGDRVTTLDPTMEPATERLTMSLQSAGDGVIVTDLQGNIEFLNLAAERLIGMDTHSAEGRPLLDILHLEESDGRAVRGDLVELATLSEAPVALGKDLILRPQAGAPKQVEGEICVRSGAGSVSGSVVTFRDVTARNWDELQRREEQKMRAIGQLAGAVAHDLNNLLTIIVGHRERIDELCEPTPQLRKSTAEIQRAADEIANVTRQLLILSRREVLFPKATNLNALLEQAKSQFTGIVPGKIELSISLEPNLGNVLVDPRTMTQAILDLVGYCCDRMPAGGKLEIATASVIVDRNCRARHLKRYVEISVKDTGPSLRGVAAEKLFEPAWTREPGRPAGLGLFTIRNVINAANGHLSMESDKDAGAKFLMSLPVIEEDIFTSEASLSTEIPSSGTQTILLVEDDDAIRILLRNSLEKRGYRVIEARNGEEAIFQAELHEDPIDLLITDVVMPVMDGPSLARQLMKARDGIRVLLISGCPNELTEVQVLVDRGAHFLQKPFTQHQLLAQVALVLSDTEAPVR